MFVRYESFSYRLWLSWCGACHEVVGIDVDQGKIDLLAAGESPVFEPGLSEILKVGVASGRLSFSTEISAAHGSQVHFITVGTPQLLGGFAADVGFVDAAVSALLPELNPGDLPPGWPRWSITVPPVWDLPGTPSFSGRGTPSATLSLPIVSCMAFLRVRVAFTRPHCSMRFTRGRSQEALLELSPITPLLNW